MAKKKDKVRFGVVFLMFLIVGLLVAGSFYLSHFVDQTFQKPNPTTLSISKDDLVFVDVFFELYSFPGCSEVDNSYIGDASLAYYVDYYDEYDCEFYVNDRKVDVDDGHYIRGLEIRKENRIRVLCRDFMGNEVSKSKTLRNYC